MCPKTAWALSLLWFINTSPITITLIAGLLAFVRHCNISASAVWQKPGYLGLRRSSHRNGLRLPGVMAGSRPCRYGLAEDGQSSDRRRRHGRGKHPRLLRAILDYLTSGLLGRSGNDDRHRNHCPRRTLRREPRALFSSAAPGAIAVTSLLCQAESAIQRDPDR